jgi:putative redox protein
MPVQTLSFPNDHGDLLAARLSLPPDGRPVAYALFAHCFTCNRNLNAVRRISQEMSDHGLAVLQFDFTGLGDSEGDFSDTGFSSNVDDLVAAARYLETHHEAPQVLIGHSLGGAAVLKATASIPSCNAVVTIGAPADPQHVAIVVSLVLPAVGSGDLLDLTQRAAEPGEFADDQAVHRAGGRSAAHRAGVAFSEACPEAVASRDPGTRRGS